MTPSKKFATNKPTCQSPKKNYDTIGMVVEEEEMVNLTLNETTGNVSIATKPQSSDISKKSNEPKSKPTMSTGQAGHQLVVICYSFCSLVEYDEEDVRPPTPPKSPPPPLDDSSNDSK